MNIFQLLNDYSISYAQEGNRHYRSGWINIRCPFCTSDGSSSFHLGIPDNGFVVSCWKCGTHPLDETLSKLLGLSIQETKKLIREYEGTPTHKTEENVRKIRIKAHRHPSGVVDLLPAHRKYLIARKFDPDQIVQEWNVQGTGPISMLDGIDYSRRIFIPILWENKEVTFQTRDITGRHPMKYLACPEDRELIKHKHIIYKHPSLKTDACICCEGVTDVWRFGVNAIATFGIEYTRQQVRLISQLFRWVAVCFDDEPQAIRQANELIAELRFRKVDAFRVDIKDDPGSMDQSEADYLVKQIL
jgi:hypothetical protein